MKIDQTIRCAGANVAHENETKFLATPSGQCNECSRVNLLRLKSCGFPGHAAHRHSGVTNAECQACRSTSLCRQEEKQKVFPSWCLTRPFESLILHLNV